MANMERKNCSSKRYCIHDLLVLKVYRTINDGTIRSKLNNEMHENYSTLDRHVRDKSVEKKQIKNQPLRQKNLKRADSFGFGRIY